MLKTIFFLLLIFFSSGGFSQVSENKLSETKILLQKSKKQNTTGWLLLGGGALMATSGYVLFVYEGLEGDGVKSVNANLALAMFYTGGAAMVSSVPFFSAAARNKKIVLASIVGLKMENSISNRHPSFVKTSYPAVSVKISL